MELTTVLVTSRRLGRHLLWLTFVAPSPAPVQTAGSPLVGGSVLGTVLVWLWTTSYSVPISRRKAEVPASRTETKSRKRGAHEESATVIGVRRVKVTAEIVAGRTLEGAGAGVERTAPLHVFRKGLRVRRLRDAFALPAEAQLILRELVLALGGRSCTLAVWVRLASVPRPCSSQDSCAIKSPVTPLGLCNSKHTECTA
jgi:hypothetical protein